jgi:hypothetical protein
MSERLRADTLDAIRWSLQIARVDQELVAYLAGQVVTE